jgi:hypothetical protein
MIEALATLRLDADTLQTSALQQTQPVDTAPAEATEPSDVIDLEHQLTVDDGQPPPVSRTLADTASATIKSVTKTHKHSKSDLSLLKAAVRRIDQFYSTQEQQKRASTKKTTANHVRADHSKARANIKAFKTQKIADTMEARKFDEVRPITVGSELVV